MREIPLAIKELLVLFFIQSCISDVFALHLAAGEEPIIIEEEIDDSPGLEGTLRLSGGKIFEGKISLPEGKKIRVYDLQARRAFYLELPRIAAIRTLIEYEGMEDAWAFEEEGFRRKVKLGYQYPLRNYLQEFELREGNLIVGHILAATIYLDDGTKEHRFKLLRQEKGTQGQKFSDLVYVESIEFTGEKVPRQSFAALSGEISGLKAVAAVDWQSLRGAAGKVQSSGSFKITGLIPGRYSIFLRLGDEVKIGLPGELKLSAAERAAVEKRVASIEEFFDQKRMVLLSGDRKRLKILMELTRSGGTTLADESGRSYRFRRWEIWVLRADGGGESGDPWHIESRIYLDRIVVPSRETIPPCSYRVDAKLQEVNLRPGENSIP